MHLCNGTRADRDLVKFFKDLFKGPLEHQLDDGFCVFKRMWFSMRMERAELLA
jgi:hypothetical protein